MRCLNGDACPRITRGAGGRRRLTPKLRANVRTGLVGSERKDESCEVIKTPRPLWNHLPGLPSSRQPSTPHRQAAAKSPRVLVSYLVGFVGGSLGGLLGIGGGSAIAPLLLLTGTLRPAQISGTTLATVFLISLVGSGAYASLGHLDLGLIWPIASGSVSGAVLGALMARRLSKQLMIVLFLLILPYFAVKELWPAFASPEISTSLVTLAVLGFSTGFLSGLLGISGASLIVPSLVAFFLVDHHTAQGIAITVALADSLAGAVTHGRGGNINYRVVVYMAGPAIVAALVGALVSNSLSSSTIRYLFVIFMGATWIGMLWRLVRDLATWRSVLRGHQGAGSATAGMPGLHTAMGLASAGTWLARRLKEDSMACFTGERIMAAMLVCFPVAIVGDAYDVSPIFVFSTSALSCVALSYWLGRATESLGSRLGPIAGGLLNATFGNAAELVISIMALSQGLFIVVRTGLIGSILGQLLLVLGTSLLIAGLKYRNLGFSRSLVQINFTLMVLAAVVIGLPTIVLAVAQDKSIAGAGFLSPTLSALLIIIYVFAVVFSLRRQPEEPDDVGGRTWKVPTGLLILVAATGGIVFISEILVGSIMPFVESTGISQVFVGLGRVHTKRSASKMSANEMNPRKITSSFSKREKMRRNPFNRRNSLSISLRLLYISRSYSHG